VNHVYEIVTTRQTGEPLQRSVNEQLTHS